MILLLEAAMSYYFNLPGSINTQKAIEYAVERSISKNVKSIVVASTTGQTALKLLQLLNDNMIERDVIVIGLHNGFRYAGHQEMPHDIQKEIINSGAKLYFGTHALSSVSRSFRQRRGGTDQLEVIAESFKRFSCGIKVTVEISVMAADAGLIPVDKDIIAIGGTGSGADSAIVLQPGTSNTFFNLKIREIICMPSTRE